MFSVVKIFIAFVFASSVSAQCVITSITASTSLTSGQPFDITWEPDSSPTVNLTLRQGDAADLNTVGTIAVGIDNNGSYTWYPPDTLISSTDYAVEIESDEGSNYSHYFAIDGDGIAESSNTTSTPTDGETTVTPTLSTSLPTEIVSPDDSISNSASTFNNVTTSASSTSSWSSYSISNTTTASNTTTSYSTPPSQTTKTPAATTAGTAGLSTLLDGIGLGKLIVLSVVSMIFYMI
jgi:Ser-Thr-rich glycosyl-phosphatidyl-inositol-anchored membrane family